MTRCIVNARIPIVWCILICSLSLTSFGQPRVPPKPVERADQDPFALIWLPISVCLAAGIASDRADGDVRGGVFYPPFSDLRFGPVIGGQIAKRFDSSLIFGLEFDVYRAKWKDNMHPAIDVMSAIVNVGQYDQRHGYVSLGVGVFVPAEVEGDSSIGLGPVFQVTLGKEVWFSPSPPVRPFIQMQYRLMRQGESDPGHLSEVYKDFDFGGLFTCIGVRL